MLSPQAFCIKRKICGQMTDQAIMRERISNPFHHRFVVVYYIDVSGANAFRTANPCTASQTGQRCGGSVPS